MALRAIAALLTLAVPVGVAAAHSTDARILTVARVVDGDTVDVSSGARVRLVQIDAPELGSRECHSRKSAAVLRSLLPAGTPVGLEADRRLDRVDRYGRLLRYVHRGHVNVNVELVRRGAATVWFYDRARGRYAARLLAEARAARASKRGLWGACRVLWDTGAPATTSPRGAPAARSACDPSYPDVCTQPPPPDLDCRDVPDRRFRLVGADPHRFDGDRDGVRCERG